MRLWPFGLVLAACSGTDGSGLFGGQSPDVVGNDAGAPTGGAAGRSQLVRTGGVGSAPGTGGTANSGGQGIGGNVLMGAGTGGRAPIGGAPTETGGLVGSGGTEATGGNMGTGSLASGGTLGRGGSVQSGGGTTGGSTGTGGLSGCDCSIFSCGSPRDCSVDAGCIAHPCSPGDLCMIVNGDMSHGALCVAANYLGSCTPKREYDPNHFAEPPAGCCDNSPTDCRTPYFNCQSLWPWSFISPDLPCGSCNDADGAVWRCGPP